MATKATSGLQMKYFVLKPSGPSPYAKASRMAMREYAKAIRADNAALADELMEWADQTHAENYAASIGTDI